MSAERSERDPSRRDLIESLRDPEARAKVSRLHDEMLEKLAPPIDGPVVSTGQRHRGRLVFGDAVD